MNKLEIIRKLQEICADKNHAPPGPVITDILSELLAEEAPKFHFALREDIKEDKSFLPSRAEPKASGWDVRAAMKDKQPLVVKPFQHVKIPLGFRSFCPNGWWYELKPRSSTFAKKNLHALYGTIDETYEGELVFACQYIPEFNVEEVISPFSSLAAIEASMQWSFKKPFPENLVINFGDAIGQLIPIRRKEMQVVEWTNEEYDNNCKDRAGARGAGGFGSTGK